MSEDLRRAALDDSALDQLFRNARSLHAFTDQPVTDEILKQLHNLWKLGPTAFNSQPGRVVFVRSAEAKKRLAPALSRSNLDKTMAAPITAIVAFDTRFFEHLPVQFPTANATAMYESNASLTETTALRNSSLQGAYLILAARALGLTAGPMSGFVPDVVNKEFFADGRYRTNFLINLGYWNGSESRPRGPRLSFEDVVQIL